MQRGKCIMNLISQYKGLRKENYVLCFGRFVTAMGAMVRPMLTMILSQKLGMNAVQVAWITALMGILTIPANLIGGKMADRFNKKMNIVYLDMISVISYIICGLLPLTTKSIVLMFIASTCQNMENPSYNSLTADITLSKDRERGYSLQYLTANLGGVMASAVAGFMFRNYLWLAFLLSGISIGTSSVLIYFFVQNITPEKEENDSNAIYQAERHGESLLTILKENRLVLLFILITSGYTALYQISLSYGSDPTARGCRCGDIRNSYQHQLLYRCSLHTIYHPDPEAILRTEKDNLRIFTDTGRLRIVHPLFRAHPVLLCGNGRTDMG